MSALIAAALAGIVARNAGPGAWLACAAAITAAALLALIAAPDPGIWALDLALALLAYNATLIGVLAVRARAPDGRRA